MVSKRIASLPWLQTMKLSGLHRMASFHDYDDWDAIHYNRATENTEKTWVFTENIQSELLLVRNAMPVCQCDSIWPSSGLRAAIRLCSSDDAQRGIIKGLLQSE